MISCRILLILIFIANYSLLLLSELTISYGSYESAQPSLSVYTDKRQYVTAEPIQISGIVLSPGGQPVNNSIVEINIIKSTGPGVIVSSPHRIASSTTAVKDGTYNLSGFSADEAGQYSITAEI